MTFNSPFWKCILSLCEVSIHPGFCYSSISLAKCVNHMNYTACLKIWMWPACHALNSINLFVLIVCQIPQLAQNYRFCTPIVDHGIFLFQTKHDRQRPGRSPLWLEQVLISIPNMFYITPNPLSQCHLIKIPSHNPEALLSVSPVPSPPSHLTNWMLSQILGTWYDSSRGND